MGETVSFQDIFNTIKKRILLIIGLMAIAVLLTGYVSYFVMTPVYQASTQILVNQSKDEQSIYSSNEIQTNLQLINTYNVIIKSAAILNQVKENLQLDMSVSALSSKINVENAQNSQVMTLSVTDSSYENAEEIANETATVFQSQIKEIMNVNNVTILPIAEESNHAPISPNPVLNMVIALVVGLLIGLGISFLLEHLDNTVKTERDIEKLLELPVLGAITVMDDSKENTKRSQKVKRNRGEVLGS